eukprot:gene18354-21891_t
METFNNNRTNRHFSIGIVFIIAGILFAAKSIGLIIPFWLLSWHSILLLIGLLIGYRKNFKAGGWIVLVLIGGIYTLQSILFVGMSSFAAAATLVGVGLYLIFKPSKDFRVLFQMEPA